MIDERVAAATPFAVQTLDGIRIEGVAIPPSHPSDVAVVLCHGFLGSWRRRQNVDLARALSERFGVFTFDFRGHGTSGGLSTVGDREAIDVHAVVRHARQQGFSTVVTVGASMGAISVLREAARFGDVDGVVSISAPGRWTGHRFFAKLAGSLVRLRLGRVVARRAFRTRVRPEWSWSPPPVEMIEVVSAPVLLIHGPDDRFIPTAQAQLLYARAKPPKRLLLIDGFGHAELGYSPAFGRTLLAEIQAMLAGDGWGAEDDPEAVRRQTAAEPG